MKRELALQFYFTPVTLISINPLINVFTIKQFSFMLYIDTMGKHMHVSKNNIFSFGGMLTKFIVFLFLQLIFTSCEAATLSDEQSPQGTVYGQVFSIGYPEPIPEGWKPPKHLHFCTVLIMNSRNDIVKEVFTDENGSFNFKIATGVYYFGLKESPIPTVTGPFEIKKDKSVYVDIYYDNEMR